MKDYTLSREKIAELEKFHRSLRDKRQADRVKAVIALSRGWSAAQVAEILLFDEKTSRHYFERYQQGGLKALLDDHYSGAEPKLDTHQMSELEGYLEEHILPDAKSVIAHIDKLYGVCYLAIFASKAADSVLWFRTGEYTFSELYLFKLCEFSGSAGLLSYMNRINSAVAIGVYPTLHKVPAAIQGVHNGLGSLTFQR